MIGNIYEARVTCIKCGRAGVMGLRLDKRGRPYLACSACTAKMFARFWSSEELTRLLALGVLLEDPQFRDVVSRVQSEVAASGMPPIAATTGQGIEAPVAGQVGASPQAVGDPK